jgi:hypothetical protein
MSKAVRGPFMPTLTQSGLVTAEVFVRMPQPEDGSRLELVEGVVISMPPPSFAHGVCCNRIGRKVGNFVEDHSLGFVTSNDSGGHDTICRIKRIVLPREEQRGRIRS